MNRFQTGRRSPATGESWVPCDRADLREGASCFREGACGGADFGGGFCAEFRVERLTGGVSGAVSAAGDWLCNRDDLRVPS